RRVYGFAGTRRRRKRIVVEALEVYERECRKHILHIVSAISDARIGEHLVGPLFDVVVNFERLKAAVDRVHRRRHVFEKMDGPAELEESVGLGADRQANDPRRGATVTTTIAVASGVERPVGINGI